MSWIKIEHALPDKPEVFRIAELLGIDPDAVAGKLLRFWAWCDINTVDGNALGVTDSVIDRVTHQPGFAAALRKVDWLQARSGSLVVPRFDRHNGQTAKARALDNRRKAAQREGVSASRPDENRTNVREQTGQNPGPEKSKRREEVHTEGVPTLELPVSDSSEPPTDKPAKPARRKSQLADAEFLAALKANPAYAGVDVDRELGKMQAWLLTPKGRGRQLTRGFIVNWLNRVDVKVDAPAAESAHRKPHPKYGC